MAGRKLGLGRWGMMKAQHKGVCVSCVLGKGVVVVEKARVGRKGRGGEKGNARHAQVLRRSDDLEKGRRQHPGTQA